MNKKIIPIKIDEIDDRIYSGFWSRLGANILDALIFLPFFFLLMFINSLSLYAYFITLIPNLLFQYHELDLLFLQHVL